ncbi:MAG: tol-pal system-associated acyl-CoA thioesterase [Methylophilus sp.]|jgi:acyl-CoA thioester hydrolase
MNNKLMHQWPLRVYYEDTDAGGVVYHSQYLNFMERARTEWVRQLGFTQTDLRENLDVIFVVHSMQIQFKKPARLDDMLVVNTQVLALGYGSFTCLQTILKDTQILIEAQVKIACVNAATFKPQGIPAPLKLSMEFV